jgi:hypothetical protein
MTDIVERLRVPCFENGLDEGWIDKERREAAAEIKRLRAVLEEIADDPFSDGEGLRNFARAALAQGAAAPLGGDA